MHKHMRLVRTFHPVGHGAFYTEQFYDGDKCVFTAVYDCGGDPEGGINSYIDANFSNQHINALFISHLHSDHISGIPYLLEKNECDKVFLPALTPNQKIEAFVYNYWLTKKTGNIANLFIEDVYKGKYNNILVWIKMYNEKDGKGYVNEGESSILINDIKNNELPTGVSIKWHQNLRWIYLPYNAKYDIGEVFIEKFKDAKDEKTGKVDFEKVKEICTNKADWDKVKDLYADAIKGSANEYSMAVYSGYEIPSECYCECCNRSPFCNNNGFCLLKPNCLFTGDYVANEENVSKLKSFYGEYFFSSPTLQVPHHGSDKIGGKKEKYGLPLFENRKDIVLSIKYGQYAGIPSEYLLSELRRKEITPQIVTDERNSRFEMTRGIKYWE